MNTDTHPHALRILRLEDVKERTRLSTSQIYYLVSKGLFPRQVKLGSTRASGWVFSEIESWVRDRISDRDQSGKMLTPSPK